MDINELLKCVCVCMILLYTIVLKDADSDTVDEFEDIYVCEPI